MAVIVHWDQGAIAWVMRSPGGPVVQDLHRRGNRVLNAARSAAPVDQGTLRASLHMENVTVNGDPAVRIGSPLAYAIYVHEGTGIYAGRGFIYPTSGRFLRWPNRGGTSRGGRRYVGGSTESYIFARRVRGVPARPFLRDALSAAT